MNTSFPNSAATSFFIRIPVASASGNSAISNGREPASISRTWYRSASIRRYSPGSIVLGGGAAGAFAAGFAAGLAGADASDVSVGEGGEGGASGMAFGGACAAGVSGPVATVAWTVAGAGAGGAWTLGAVAATSAGADFGGAWTGAAVAVTAAGDLAAAAAWPFQTQWVEPSATPPDPTSALLFAAFTPVFSAK